MAKVIDGKTTDSSFNDNELASLIKKHRKEKGWTYEKMAERIDFSASYIYRIEKGQRHNPSAKFLMQVCDLFGLDINLILSLQKPSILVVNGISIDIKIIEELLEIVAESDFNKTKDMLVILERLTMIQDKIKNR